MYSKCNFWIFWKPKMRDHTRIKNPVKSRKIFCITLILIEIVFRSKLTPQFRRSKWNWYNGIQHPWDSRRFLPRPGNEI